MTGITGLQFIQLLRFSVLFLVGIVLVRYYPKQEIGQYESFLFIAGALTFFWLRGVLQTFLALGNSDGSDVKSSKSSSSDVYFNSFVLLVAFSLLSALFLLIFKQQIQFLINGEDSIPFFYWLVAYLLLAPPSNFIEYIFLKKEKPKKIIVYGIISYGLQFLFVIIPPLAGLAIDYSIQGLVLISLMRFVFLFIILKRYSRFTLSVSFLKEHLKLAYPLIGSSLLSGSGQYIDGVIVSHFYSPEVFAVFRYGARELPLVLIMANALSHAMIHQFGRLSMDDALLKLKTSSVRLMHFLFPVSGVFLVLSNVLFPWFFSTGFAESAKIFNIYLLLIVVRLVFPETILIGKKITNVFLAVSLGEIILNVILSIAFLPLFGLVGVAYATLLANFFERILLIVIVKRRLHLKLKEYVPIRLYCSYSVAFLLLYVLVDFVIFN